MQTALMVLVVHSTMSVDLGQAIINNCPPHINMDGILNVIINCNGGAKREKRQNVKFTVSQDFGSTSRWNELLHMKMNLTTKHSTNFKS